MRIAHFFPGEAASILASTAVAQFTPDIQKRKRQPFQELPVLSEDYGNDDDDEEENEENPGKIDLPDESQMLDIVEGDDGEYLPEQIQDGIINL